MVMVFLSAVLDIVPAPALIMAGTSSGLVHGLPSVDRQGEAHPAAGLAVR